MCEQVHELTDDGGQSTSILRPVWCLDTHVLDQGTQRNSNTITTTSGQVPGTKNSTLIHVHVSTLQCEHVYACSIIHVYVLHQLVNVHVHVHTLYTHT